VEKKRVYEIAKDFHVSSEALISMLKDMSFNVKSHMSVLDDEMLKAIQTQFSKQQNNALKEIEKKEKITKAIDQKKTAPEEPKLEEKPEAKTRQRSRNRQKQVRNEKTAAGKFAPVIAEHGTEEKKSRGKHRKKKKKVDQVEVQNTYKKTMATITSDSKSKPKRSKPKHASAVEEDQIPTVKVSEFISISELAAQMGIPAKNLIQKCFELGMMVSINHRLDMDSIELLSDAFGYKVEKMGEFGEDMLKERHEASIDESTLTSRPPVVTVMGHVDHGKTTLLDFIRRASVVSTESGGITQHIGAYTVTLRNGQKITFIDTPGHQAFTAMRARGVKVTDIVILIVAADDGVMPQTLEAIDHARAAEVPIVIAINKIDLPTANADRIRTELSQRNILVEEWGGSYQCQEISAKKGIGTFELLDKVLLESEMLELKADHIQKASGVVIESHVDRGRGTIATVLIQDGTLRIGDPFIAGMIAGNVRAMINDHGERITIAGPSDPVQILGMDGIPRAGDTFYAVESETEAREIAQQRSIIKREQHFRRLKRVTLDALYDQIKDGSVEELKLIIKADVDGSVGALSDTLTQISHEEVRVNVIHSGVGGINENDVLLAAASGAIIIGFHVRPTHEAKHIAASENVEIKLYDIIYEAIDDVKKALSGLLKPIIKEKVNASVEIRQVFKIPKVGNVAGSYVVSGTVHRGSMARLIRDNIVVYDGKISSLRRLKDDVSEVSQGYECGLNIEGFNDYKVGDTIELYELLKEARKL
jgi:translation initiation factor IF-2